MKSKFDAFRNLYGIREPQESKHEEDVIFYTKWFSMQMSTQKWSRRDGLGHINKKKKPCNIAV